MYDEKEKIYSAYISKHNSNRKKQVIFLMISIGEKPDWSKTLAMQSLVPMTRNYVHRMKTMASSCPEKLSELLRGITSKHYRDFYCLNCHHSFRTKTKFESHENVCENKDFCNVIMLSEDTKILKLNQYQKYDKAPFIIYANLECIIEKT